MKRDLAMQLFILAVAFCMRALVFAQNNVREVDFSKKTNNHQPIVLTS